MECSMEMKMQAIDKMLEMRKQLSVIQNNLGMWNSADDTCPVLVYQTEDFFEVANEVNASVQSGDITDKGMIEISFDYKDVKFHTFILPGEYQLHEHEIDRGDSDA